jgi:predicted outer membrane repeat protein
MSGNAAISGNTADGNGGGMYSSAKFTISDNAVINGNMADGNGGGLFVGGWDNTMSGDAAISGNTADGGGGGVYFYYGTFTMSDDAVISGNTTNGDGGGVVVHSGTFAISGHAAISKNTASGGGGGVYISDTNYFDGDSFTMSGDAAISGNMANGEGGGVFINSRRTASISGGSFTKIGGIIYGSNGGVLANTSGQGDTYGHAVYCIDLLYIYISYFSYYYRDLTLNADDDISTQILPDSGTGGNWTKKEE